MQELTAKAQMSIHRYRRHCVVSGLCKMPQNGLTAQMVQNINKNWLCIMIKLYVNKKKKKNSNCCRRTHGSRNESTPRRLAAIKKKSH